MAKIGDMQTVMNNKQVTQGQTLSDLVKRIDVVKRFEEVLGKKTPGFIASILSLQNASPQLKLCDPKSILSAAMIAATLDLPINSQLGFAAIVPYKTQATFQIMVRGLIQLAIRTGQYKTINATEVYEGEIEENDRLTGRFVINEEGRKSEKIIGFVSYFRLNSGFEKSLFMSVEQVRSHAKKFSKSFGNPNTPWATNFEGMAMKTVLKLLLGKYGVLSVEMQKQGESVQEEGLQKAIQYDQAVVADTIEGEKVSYPDNPENDSIEPTEAPAKEEPNKEGDLPLKS